MRWRPGRTDIGVRLRILVREPPSTPTQPDPLDERRDLVGFAGECRAKDFGDRGVVGVALRADDDALGHRNDGGYALGPVSRPRNVAITSSWARVKSS
jgi:hypothetical protein